ncbi:MAG TPA: hypothetical protein ENG50_00540 [Candidatus Altiarchaeales archaeon]|nr:hypothetical protein [Candidatus Altiarchaeales archaeon]
MKIFDTSMRLLKSLRNIRVALVKFRLLYTLENTLIIFLVSLIALKLLGIIEFSTILAFFIAIGYFLYNSFFKKMDDEEVIEEICKKYPKLAEKLKTAYDYRYRNDFLLRRLSYKVLDDISQVRLSSFLDLDKVQKKGAIIAVLALLLITLNFFDFTLMEFHGIDVSGLFSIHEALKENFDVRDISKGLLDFLKGYEIGGNYSIGEENLKSAERGGGNKREGFSQGELQGRGIGAGETAEKDIFGKLTSANIEGIYKDAKIAPNYGGDISIPDTEMKESQARSHVPEIEKIAHESSEMYSESLDNLRFREYIRRYFELIKEAE